MESHGYRRATHDAPRPGLGVHRNVYDLQRIAAVKRLDRQIAEDHANGYGVDRDALLDRRLELMQLLRLGPTS